MIDVKRNLSLIKKEMNPGTRVLFDIVIISYFYLYNIDVCLYIYFLIFSFCLDIPPCVVNFLFLDKLRRNAAELCKRKACDNRVATAWVY